MFRRKRIYQRDKQVIKTTRKQGYDKTSAKMEIEKAHNIPHATLLPNNNIVKERKHPIIVTYNKNLPNIKKAIDDNWHILSIIQTISEHFTEKLTEGTKTIETFSENTP